VVKIENRFDDVRKRAVSDVVQERGDANGNSGFVVDFVFVAEFI
jgi:hypothetical protein